MRAIRASSLAVLLLLVGEAAAADAVTVYRCTDAQGRVSLQDAPCDPGQSGTRREMQRPVDPPPRPVAPATPAPAAPPAPPPDPAPVVRLPPPAIYACTDYDGALRHSEDYDPRDRCVPLGMLGYDLRGAPPDVLNRCRWVRESCVRLDDGPACRVFDDKLRQARSDALHAFSDTAAFRKSEVRRLEQIVAESCR